MKRIKCPWCTKLVKISKSGNLGPHVTPGNQQCVGVGQPAQLALSLLEKD